LNDEIKKKSIKKILPETTRINLQNLDKETEITPWKANKKNIKSNSQTTKYERIKLKK